MRPTIACIVAALLAAGCRSDPYAPVREQEWRRLEDEIYCLRGSICDLESRLESARRENEALRRRAGDDSPASESLPTPNRRTPADLGPGPADSGRPDDESLENLMPPRTDLGPEGSLPPIGDGSKTGTSVEIQLASHEGVAGAEQSEAPAESQTDPNCKPTAPATLIRLNPRLTGGNNTDGRYGDEGIMAVIEARDADGNLVTEPGPITLSVHDPKASNGSLVAVWDFTADEVAARFRRSPFGTGIHFELPWPNEPPRRALLRLDVRCEPPAGKPLTARHRFSIEVPGAASPGAKTPKWSPNR